MTLLPHEAAAELTSPDPALRQLAVRRLGAAAPVDALAQLVREDPSPWVRLEAVGALAAHGAPGVAALTLALADQVLWVRLHAARMLSGLGEAGALALLSVEHSRCQEASAAAAWARGLTRADLHVDALVMTLAYEEDAAWQAAQAALPRLNRAQVAELRAALDRAAAEERAAAAQALGVIGDPDAVDDLETLLRDGEDVVCKRAAEALGRIGSPRSVPALLAALDDAGELVALEIVGALGRCRDPRAVPTLVRVLQGDSWTLAGAAAHALAAIGDDAARAALAAAAAGAQPGNLEAERALAALEGRDEPE